MSESLERMPDPSEFASYTEYREKAYKWEHTISNQIKYEVLPINLTAFYSRPEFDKTNAKYKSTYPKFNHQVSLIKTALGYEKEIDSSLDGWISSDPGWNGLLIDQHPNPEFYNDKNSYCSDFVNYINNLQELVNGKLQNFNENGNIQIKGDKYIDNENYKLITAPHSPEEMGKILSIEKVHHTTPKINEVVQEQPKNSSFYEWCMKEAKPYESVDLVTSLKNAYESIPYIYMFKRTPEEFKNVGIYGPSGDKGVPMIFKENKKEKNIDAIGFIQIANYDISKLRQEILRKGYLFIRSCISNNNFAFLEDIHGLYFFTLTYASTLQNGFIITKAYFNEANATNNQLVIRAHSYFVEVAISNSLVTLARIDGNKSIETFAKTRLKHSENRLYALINKEGQKLNEYFLTHEDLNSSKIFSVILKTIISYETSDCKKFLKIFKYLEFSVLNRIHASSSEFFREFTILVNSSPILNSRYLINFAHEIVKSDLNDHIIRFYCTITNIKGSKIPDQILTKCEWIGQALSKLFVLTNEGSEWASELMKRIVKMTARGRAAQSKLRSGSWETAVTQNSYLLLKMLSEPLPQRAFVNIYSALVSFSREKPFFDFFIKKENLKSILCFFRLTDPPEVMKLSYRLIRRLFLFHTEKVLQLLQNDHSTRSVIVGCIRDISLPCSIDVIRVLSCLIERLVIPEKKTSENTQVGFLFAVVALPPIVVSVMRITQEAGFFPGRVLKVLKTERFNIPEISMKYGHIIHFYDVLTYRKTVMRMVLNYGVSSSQ